MDDVESIILTSCWLLDATEVSLVAETKHGLICFFALDVATPHAEAQYSSVEEHTEQRLHTHKVCSGQSYASLQHAGWLHPT